MARGIEIIVCPKNEFVKFNMTISVCVCYQCGDAIHCGFCDDIVLGICYDCRLYSFYKNLLTLSKPGIQLVASEQASLDYLFPNRWYVCQMIKKYLTQDYSSLTRQEISAIANSQIISYSPTGLWYRKNLAPVICPCQITKSTTV